MNRLQDSSLSVHTASCTSSGEEMPRRHDHGIRPLRSRARGHHRRHQSDEEWVDYRENSRFSLLSTCASYTASSLLNSPSAIFFWRVAILFTFMIESVRWDKQ